MIFGKTKEKYFLREGLEGGKRIDAACEILILGRQMPAGACLPRRPRRPRVGRAGEMEWTAILISSKASGRPAELREGTV